MKTARAGFLFLVVLCGISARAFSQDGKACQINDTINDYAIYSDNRNGNGILEIMSKGNNAYLVRKYNLDTKAELMFKVSFIYTETQIKSSDFTVIKGKDEGDYKELMDDSRRVDNVTVYSYATLYQNNKTYFSEILKSIIAGKS